MKKETKEDLVKEEVMLVFHRPSKSPLGDKLTVKMCYVERVPDVVAVFKRSGFKLIFKETRRTFEHVTYEHP